MNNVFINPKLILVETYDLKGSKHNRKTKDKTQLQNPTHTRLDLDLTRQFAVGAKTKKKLMKQIKNDAEFLAKHNIMDYSLLIGIYRRKQKIKKKRKSPQKKQSNDRKTETVDTKSAVVDGTENLQKTKEKHISCSENQRELLTTVQTVPRKEQLAEEEENKTTQLLSGVWSVDHTEFYQLGIIDILQPYNSTKKAANFFKSLRWKSVRLSYQRFTLSNSVALWSSV